MHSSLFLRSRIYIKGSFLHNMNLCIKFTSLSSNPAAANSKPEPKKRNQSNNPTHLEHGDLWSTNQCPSRKKNGVPKKHPLGFGRFFSEVTFLQAQCHLAWRSWCDSCISDESWGEFWSINFDKKTMGETGFFPKKNSWVCDYGIWVEGEFLMNYPPTHVT